MTAKKLDPRPVEFLTRAEAAAFLHKSEAWVKKMTNAEKLPCRYVGRDPIYLRHELEDWVLAQHEPCGL